MIQLHNNMLLTLSCLDIYEKDWQTFYYIKFDKKSKSSLWYLLISQWKVLLGLFYILPTSLIKSLYKKYFLSSPCVEIVSNKSHYAPQASNLFE